MLVSVRISVALAMHNDQSHHEGRRLANDSSTYTPLSASSHSRVSGHHPVLLTHVRAACLQAEQLGTLDEAGGPCVIEELPFNSPELAGLPQSADVPQVRSITAINWLWQAQMADNLIVYMAV